jgi:hypothetical protein
MRKTSQRQGVEFEGQFSKPLHSLVRNGMLLSASKRVNNSGTPFDFEAWGALYTYAIECKSLIEGKANKAYSLRLSCLTDNEWIGMRNWIASPYRKAWVVWKSTLLTGDVCVYAVPFDLIEQTRSKGAKHLWVGMPEVRVIGRGDNPTYWDIWKIFQEYEEP